MGEDGNTGCRRLKGKKYRGDDVEFGEKVLSLLKRGARQEKLEPRRAEGIHVNKVWRTGEAIIGTKSGVRKSWTIRRVGGHRRWDAEGLGVFVDNRGSLTQEKMIHRKICRSGG